MWVPLPPWPPGRSRFVGYTVSALLFFITGTIALTAAWKLSRALPEDASWVSSVAAIAGWGLLYWLGRRLILRMWRTPGPDGVPPDVNHL